MAEDEKLKDNLVEMYTKGFLKMQFESKTLEKYWCCAMNMFRDVVKKH